MTLIEKFDAVKISDSALLPEEDIRVCETVQKEYQAAMKELLEVEAFHALKVEEENNSFYTINDNSYKGYSGRYNHKSRYGRTVEKSYGSVPINDFSKFRFTWKYGFCVVEDLKLNLQNEFIDRITRYFSDKYNISIEPIPDDKIASITSYQKILRHIDEKCGGLDMKRQAVNQAMERWKAESGFYTDTKNWRYRNSDYKKVFVIKKTIEMVGLNVGFPDKLYEAFSGALSIFEKDEYIEKFVSPDFPTSPIANSKYEMSDKFERVVFIKQQRAKLIIGFKDEFTAREFCNYFSLEVSKKEASDEKS